MVVVFFLIKSPNTEFLFSSILHIAFSHFLPGAFHSLLPEYMQFQALVPILGAFS